MGVKEFGLEDIAGDIKIEYIIKIKDWINKFANNSLVNIRLNLG